MTVGMICCGRDMVVECNVIKRFHYNPYKTLNYSGSFMCNCCTALTFRNNVITENMSAGAAGGPGRPAHRWASPCTATRSTASPAAGSTSRRASSGTVLRWNTVFDNYSGIDFRANCANTAFENYIFNNRPEGLGHRHARPGGHRAQGRRHVAQLGDRQRHGRRHRAGSARGDRNLRSITMSQTPGRQCCFSMETSSTRTSPPCGRNSDRRFTGRSWTSLTPRRWAW